MYSESSYREFYDKLSNKLKHSLETWVLDEFGNEGEGDPDNIWTKSGIDKIIYEDLFSLKNDKEWSNNITNGLIYSIMGIFDGLEKSMSFMAKGDNYLKILINLIISSIMWQLENGIVKDYMNH